MRQAEENIRIIGKQLMDFTPPLSTSSHYITNSRIFGQYNVIVLLQPPYSPDMTTHNFFFLLLEMKSTMKGQCSKSNRGNKEKPLSKLKSIPIHAFLKYSVCWKEH